MIVQIFSISVYVFKYIMSNFVQQSCFYINAWSHGWTSLSQLKINFWSKHYEVKTLRTSFSGTLEHQIYESFEPFGDFNKNHSV